MKAGKNNIRKNRSRVGEGPAWKAAEAYGVDMAMLAANLKRTTAERIRRHDEALQAFLMLSPKRRKNVRSSI